MSVFATNRGKFAWAERPTPLARRSGAKAARFSSAFTLIEIMVVVAIMGLILAAGIPSLYGIFHKEGLRKSMSDLIETCRSARTAAIISGQTADLVIHPRENTLQVSGGNGQFGGQVHTAKLDGVKIWGIELNNDPRTDYSTAEEVRVHFFPNGTSEEMVMILATDNNEMKGITLDIMTGMPILMSDADINALRH